jgi:chromosome segregation ATPase
MKESNSTNEALSKELHLLREAVKIDLINLQAANRQLRAELQLLKNEHKKIKEQNLYLNKKLEEMVILENTVKSDLFAAKESMAETKYKISTVESKVTSLHSDMREVNDKLHIKRKSRAAV